MLIGLICKLANRPRSEARHDVYAKGMFQPSAAGYGSRRAPATADNSMEGTSASANLLDSASPMGSGGRYTDPDVSAGGSSDSHTSRTHVRGKSSGVNFPGPPAAFRRGGGGQQHPQLGQQTFHMDSAMAGPSFSDAAPDGSGFQPGQVFNYGALNGGAPRMPTGAPNGYAPRQGSLRPTSMARGPPPALSRSRSGRYAQGADPSRRSRIDSVGPGTYRKSLYLPEDGGRKSIFLTEESTAAYLSINEPVQRKPSNGRNAGGLRRVDSIGKGDPRRVSNYNGSGGGKRGLSVYDNGYDGAAGPGQPSVMTRGSSMNQSGAGAGAGAGANGYQVGRVSPGRPDAPHMMTSGPLGPLGPSSNARGPGYSGPSDGYAHMPPSGYAGMNGYGGGGRAGGGGGGMYPGARMQAVEGVGSGGGRQIL